MRKALNRAAPRWVVAMLLAAFLCNAAVASDRLHRFNVPRQPAALALNAFAQQADQQVLYPLSRVSGITTNALVGRFTPTRGIEILLEGTGLRAEFGKHGVITIESRTTYSAEFEESHMQNSATKSGLSKLLAMLLGTLGAQGVSAQAPDDDLSLTIEEVVVTAQRREQNLQDVPVSLTAFTAEMLDQQNIEEVKDFAKFTPNVSFTEDGEVGSRSVGISIRGVSDFANTFTGVGGLANSFGIYLDEFNIANNATKTANPNLYDLAGLEILRGPQGTYFGSNATGGALNLTTKLPHEEFEAELVGGYSRFNTWELKSMVNLPVTDSLFLRAGVAYTQSDGFIENLSPTGNDASFEHTSVRVAARWLATDDFTADLSVMRTIENDGTDSNVNSGVLDFNTPRSTPNILPVDPLTNLTDDTVFAPVEDIIPVDSGGGFFPDNRRIVNKDFYELNKNRQTIVNLRLNYTGDGWVLRSITGFMDTTSRRQFDQDVTQYAFAETYNGRTGDTFSQELRFSVERDTWDWVVGAIYSNDDADAFKVSPIGRTGFFRLNDRDNDLLPDGTLAPGLPGGCFCLNPGDIISGPQVKTFDSESWAVYSEANWQFRDTFTLTVGARYTEHDVKVQVAEWNRSPFQTLPFDRISDFEVPDASELRSPLRSGSASFSSVTPRVVLMWQPADTLNVYTSVSKGYKPGGLVFSDRTGERIPFEKESLWNYELGAKWRGFGNRLSINAAAFYMDWQNLQMPSVEIFFEDGVMFNNFQINNTEARSLGFELEAQAILGNHLSVGGGAGYLDAEFESFGADDPFIIQNMGFDIEGETLPRSPKWTLNLFAQYDFTIRGLDGWVRAEWLYRSESTSDIEATVSGLPILDNEVTRAAGLDTQFSGDGISNGFAFPWPRADYPIQIPSFDVVNVRAGLASGDRWSVVAYVENLFDENYYTGTQENFGFGGFRIRPHFRVAGINLKLTSR
ncbi:TonB-dependent receptor domain-containing protein [Elongatibacter sediminis]|uniref:TonB-dependent receptor n=1 Tax=Elongatibacter sediminis TaxID=3119006 RepID=A0AAW9R8Z8_9GAMM